MLAAAAIAGGAAGWAAGNQASGGTAGSATVASHPAVSGPDVPGVLSVAEPSIASIDTTFTYRQGPFAQQRQGAGTGVVLTSDGYVLTNAHVVSDAGTITVTLPGSDTGYTATVVGADTGADVAVVNL